MSISKKQRFEGCLIGGAIGDALGYPVEFLTERQIRFDYGEKGICTLEEAGNPAVISDDTQMTLFAAHALIYNKTHSKSDWSELLRNAYREWYVTQTGDESLLINGKPQMEIYNETRLHQKRAPGNTCLSAIRSYIQEPEKEFAENDSKGCGTVMRAAPFGLAENYDPNASHSDAGKQAFTRAKYDAQLTHGHEDAWKSSATLASIVFYIAQYFADDTDKRLQDVIAKCLDMWNDGSCVRRAISLAEDTTVDDLDAIHQLGQGWVADEALAIAIFCAVRHQDDFAKAIRAAVNHKGDSDSTGAICGNILGAWLGIDEVKKAFNLECLEMQELIMKTADELYSATVSEDKTPDSNMIVLEVDKILANDRIGFYRLHNGKHLVEIREDETYESGVYCLLEETDKWEEDYTLSSVFAWDMPVGKYDAFLPQNMDFKLALYAFINSSKRIFIPDYCKYYAHFDENGIALIKESQNNHHMHLPRGWDLLRENYIEPACRFIHDALNYFSHSSTELTECLNLFLSCFKVDDQNGQTKFFGLWREGKIREAFIRLEKLVWKELFGIFEEDSTKYTEDVLENIANKTYPGTQMFARDVNLNPDLAEKYKPGMIICERGFTDATSRFMGMATSHRFIILSNHMANFSVFENGTNWGLHTAKAGSHFKVLGQSECKGKVGIFLLHLPDDEDWKAWETVEFSMDNQLYQMALHRFEMKCNADVIPELTTDIWLDRCAAPLGMDDNGNLFEL